MDQSDFLSQSRTRLSDDLLPQYTESFRMLWTKIDQNINFLVLFIIQVARPLTISPELLARIVECPPFADSISEGDISWMKEVGDSVTLDETVGEVETDKTSLPVNAPAAGVVTKLLVEDGETVTPGTPLFEMEEGAGGAAPAAPAAKAAEPKPAEAAPAAAVAAAPIPTEAPKAAPVPSKPMSSSKTDFTAVSLEEFRL